MVTSDEIRQAVFDMAPFKAPGPDGLHARFYQHLWPLLKNYVCQFVLDFFHTGILPSGVNDTPFTLSPMVFHLEHISQFRPISLCNVSYKIIAKTMDNRLKEIMQDVIAPNQSSFVSGRQIIDNVVRYQEVLYSMCQKNSRKGIMTIKKDLEKA